MPKSKENAPLKATGKTLIDDKELAELRRYARLGRAALMPGMQHMVALMQVELAEHKRAIANGEAALNSIHADFSEEPEEEPEPEEEELRRQLKQAKPRRQKALPPVTDVVPKKRVGRPSRAGNNRHGKPVTSNYWSQFTPEERKLEIARRRAVTRGELPSMDPRTRKGKRAA